MQQHLNQFSDMMKNQVWPTEKTETDSLGGGHRQPPTSSGSLRLQVEIETNNYKEQDRTSKNR